MPAHPALRAYILKPPTTAALELAKMPGDSTSLAGTRPQVRLLRRPKPGPKKLPSHALQAYCKTQTPKPPQHRSLQERQLKSETQTLRTSVIFRGFKACLCHGCQKSRRGLCTAGLRNGLEGSLVRAVQGADTCILYHAVLAKQNITVRIL